MEAVVYTSNTGSTEHYAKLLGHELRVSVYSTEEAGNKLPTGTEIIYLGWIMAGKIQRFGLARKNIRFVQYVQLEWDRREHSERRYGKRTIFRERFLYLHCRKISV